MTYTDFTGLYMVSGDFPRVHMIARGSSVLLLLIFIKFLSNTNRFYTKYTLIHCSLEKIKKDKDKINQRTTRTKYNVLKRERYSMLFEDFPIIRMADTNFPRAHITIRNVPSPSEPFRNIV